MCGVDESLGVSQAQGQWVQDPSAGSELSSPNAGQELWGRRGPVLALTCPWAQ